MFSEFNGLVSRIVNLTKANMDALQLEDSTWVTQMKNAMNVNGGDIENATFIDYLLHFLTFFWKVCFTEICNDFGFCRRELFSV